MNHPPHPPEVAVVGRGGATRCTWERALHFASVARERGRVVLFAGRDELGTLRELAWVGAVGRVRPDDIEAVVLVAGEPQLYTALRRGLGSAVQRAPLDRSFNMLFALLGDQLASGPLGLSVSGPPVGLNPHLPERPIDTSFAVLVDDLPKPDNASEQTLPPQPERSVAAYDRAQNPGITRKRGTPA